SYRGGGIPLLGDLRFLPAILVNYYTRSWRASGFSARRFFLVGFTSRGRTDWNRWRAAAAVRPLLHIVLAEQRHRQRAIPEDYPPAHQLLHHSLLALDSGLERQANPQSQPFQ